MIINYIKMYLVTFIIFFVIDLIWIGFIATNIYKKHIGHLLLENPNLFPAFIFYALYVLGLLFFVINPALEKQSLKEALISGMFFGLICYSTYDLTNLATLKNWSTFITIIDILWGTFLGGFVSLSSYFIINKIVVFK